MGVARMTASLPMPACFFCVLALGVFVGFVVSALCRQSHRQSNEARLYAIASQLRNKKLQRLSITDLESGTIQKDPPLLTVSVAQGIRISEADPGTPIHKYDMSLYGYRTY